MKKLFLKPLYFLTPILLVFILMHLLYFNTDLNRSISLEYKQDNLGRNRKNRKIVLIGGSNCRYSYDSEVLKQEFPTYSIVNSALSAPNGLKFYLEFITPFLQEGDIVILSPEYLFLTTDNGIYGNKDFILLAKSYPSFYHQVFSDIPSSKHFLSLSFNHFLVMIERMKLNSSKTWKEKELSVSKFHDKTGQVSYYPETREYANYKIFVNEYPSKSSIKILKKYISYFSDKGIHFYINFPPAEKSRYIQTISDQDYCNFIIKKIPTIKLLNTPSESVYDISLFYNSPYHLNERGKLIHTKKMSKKLKLLSHNWE